MPRLNSKSCGSALHSEEHNLAPLWPLSALRFPRTRSSFNSFLSGTAASFTETLPAPHDQAFGLPEYGVPTLGPSGADVKLSDADAMVADMEAGDQYEPVGESASPDMADPDSSADSASGMSLSFGSVGAAHGLPKMTGSASSTGVLEFWSTTGASGGGAKLLTDGDGGERAVPHTSAHQEHYQEKIPSHNPHDDSKAHINADHASPVKARQVDQHPGQESATHADQDSHAETRDDEAVETVIMNNVEDKGMHLVPFLGGLVAVFGHLYLWGTVFVTLCKPARAASPAPPAVQSGQPSAAGVSTFSGAAGRPGTSGNPTPPSSTPS